MAAQREVATIFGGPVNIYLPHGTILEPVVSADERRSTTARGGGRHLGVEHGQMAGNGTDTLPDARASTCPSSPRRRR